MRKLYIIIALLLLAVNVHSAPSVTGSSGTFANGNSVTITGSGFGTKSPAAPLVWQPHESCTTGAEVGTCGYFQEKGNPPNAVVISTGRKYGNYGTKSALMLYPGTGIDGWPQSGFNLPNILDMYMSYNNYYECYGCATRTSNTQFKFTRGGSRTQGGVGVDCYHGYDAQFATFRWPTADPGYFQNEYSTGNDSIYSYSYNGPLEDQWSRIEYRYKLSDPAGSGNGIFTTSVNGVLMPDSPGTVETRPSGNFTIECVMPFVGWDRYAITPSSASWRHYVDDVYIDSTPARVEICSGATWANKGKCEVQIPSAWASGSITATVNQGLFEPTYSTYVYVIDSTGTANTSGYQITFGSGGGGGSDTSPPYTSQWSPAKGSTGVLTTNRTISAHILDSGTNATGVLSSSIYLAVSINGGTYNYYTPSTGLTVTGTSSDYTITRTQGSDWDSGASVSVKIGGRDVAGNWMTEETYAYQIAIGYVLNIVTTSLTPMTVGTFSTKSFTATGGQSPYTWSILSGSLPGGVNLSSGGVLSGTPDNVYGTFNFTAKVVDNLGSTDNQALSLVVNPAAPGGQVTVSITNIQDTFINSGSVNTNYSSDNLVRTYTWPVNTTANMIFDNIVLGLPDNVSILSGRLYYYLEGHDGSGGTNPDRIYAQRVSGTVPTISSVTWVTFAGTLESYESYALDSAGSPDVSLTPGWYSWDVTNMVAWSYANTSPLYVALSGMQGGLTDTNRYFTSMEGEAAFRPYLSVTYMQLVGPPGPSISAPGKMRVSKFRGRFH